MATAIKLRECQPMPPLPVRRFSVDEYHEMIENGILDRGGPCELLHGWIIPKMGINPPHAYAVSALSDLLVPLVDEFAVVRTQQPITTPDSEPEPGLVVATGSRRDYKKRHPAPKDILLLVEVSDSTLREDRTTKLELYAGAGIVRYWIVNLVASQIEAYSHPRGGRTPKYLKKLVFSVGQQIPLVIDDERIGSLAIDEILP